MWFAFDAVSLLCSEKFLLSNTSKFQFANIANEFLRAS